MNFSSYIQTRINALQALYRGALRDPASAWISSDTVVLQPANLKIAISKSTPLVGANQQELWVCACHELAALCDRASILKQPLHLLVSDYWFISLVLTLGREKISDFEVESLLTDQFNQRYGDLNKSWKFAWDTNGGYLTSLAFSKTEFDRLTKELDQRQIKLTSMKPISSVILEGLSDVMNDCWLAIVQGKAFSIIRFDKKIIRDWRIIKFEGAPLDSLFTHLLRQAARNSDECRLLTVVDLTMSINKSNLKSNFDQRGWKSHFISISELTGSNAYGWSRLLGL